MTCDPKEFDYFVLQRLARQQKEKEAALLDIEFLEAVSEAFAKHKEKLQELVGGTPSKGNDADIPAGNAKRLVFDEIRNFISEQSAGFYMENTSLLDKCRDFLNVDRVDVYENGHGDCYLVRRKSGDFLRYNPAISDFSLADVPQIYRIKKVTEIVNKRRYKGKANNVQTLDSVQEG